MFTEFGIICITIWTMFRFLPKCHTGITLSLLSHNPCCLPNIKYRTTWYRLSGSTQVGIWIRSWVKEKRSVVKQTKNIIYLETTDVSVTTSMQQRHASTKFVVLLKTARIYDGFIKTACHIKKSNWIFFYYESLSGNNAYRYGM